MTVLQKITLRLSEVRTRLNAISGLEGEALTGEITAESDTLQTEYKDLETRHRAAILAAPDQQEIVTATVDSEMREKLEIRSKTGLADFLSAAAGGREVTGAAKEYADSVGCSPLNRIPLDIFKDGEPETRAITPGPAVDGAVEPAVPFVFKRSAAASLGIQMPSHGAGAVQIPRVTTAPPADTLAKDAAAPSTAAAIALDSQTPKRISGQFEVRAEDLAVFPALEAVLGESIRGALSNELDEEVFNGVAAGLNGLFRQADNVTVDSAVETYATGIGRFAALIDGQHAYTLADVRCVVGPSTYALYMGLISDGMPLGDYLETKLGSFRVSSRMPAIASKGQKGIVTLNGGPSPIRVYVWNALEITRDPFSGAGAGKITLTATALVSEVYIPHGTSQVKEINPKLVA